MFHAWDSSRCWIRRISYHHRLHNIREDDGHIGVRNIEGRKYLQTKDSDDILFGSRTRHDISQKSMYGVLIATWILSIGVAVIPIFPAFEDYFVGSVW